MKTSNYLVAALSFLSLSAFACGGEVGGESPEVKAGEPIASQELSITKQTSDRVEGNFHRDNQTLQFELFAIEGGRMARILDEAGEPLIETSLKDGIEDSSLLGGQARLRGSVLSLAPETEGDGEIFRKMEKIPAIKLVPDLKNALRSAGVEGSFFSANEASQKPGLTTKNWLDVWGYWHLSCNESHDFPTWTFWGWTTFELRPEYSQTTAALHVLTPWYNPTEYTGVFSGTIRIQRQYAGYAARVTNNSVAINGYCSSPLQAKAY